MKLIRWMIILLFCISSNSFSQKIISERSYIQMFYDSDAFLYEENYFEAASLLSELNVNYPENANINFLLGYCYLNLPNEEKKAFSYLEKAVAEISEKYKSSDHTEDKAPQESLFYLGKAYHLVSQFDKAIEMFEDFNIRITDQKKNAKLKEDVERQIQICSTAIELTAHPIEMEVMNLGRYVNSKYKDHSPVISADESTLIFTSKREGTTGGEMTEFGEYFEDIYISEFYKGEWVEATGISPNINTGVNEASIGLSADGQQLFIYRDDKGDGNIYYSQLAGKKWSVPVKLGPEINSSYRETHVSLSADQNSLYFSSNRKGGYGGMDIYVSKKMPDGKWSMAQNLGPAINTPYDEEGPFIHYDRVTLFFSSNGHKTMGGFDVFYSRMDNNGIFGEPKNIGYPVNTIDNDVFYNITPDGKRVYYASMHEDTYGNIDIYMAKLKTEYDRPLAVVTGVVVDEDGDIPQDLTISITDSLTQEPLGIYKPNSSSGKYLFILPSEKKFKALFESPLYRSCRKSLYITKESAYNRIDRSVQNDTVIMKKYELFEYITFRYGSTNLSPESDKKIENIKKNLKQNEDLIVLISFQKEAGDSAQLAEQRLTVLRDTLDAAGRTYTDAEKANKASPLIYALAIKQEKQPLLIAEMKDTIQSDTLNIIQASDSIKEKITTIENLFFDFDSYAVKAEYQNNLVLLCDFMKRNPLAVIQIAGFTDSKGTSEYNFLLSYRRAKSVKDFLVEKGVDQKNMIIQKYGETDPLVQDKFDDGSDNPQARSLNRRVEFALLHLSPSEKLEIKPVSVPENIREKSEKDNRKQEVKSDEKKFTIQLCALRIPKDISYFKELEGVKYYKCKDGFHRYFYGEFKTRTEAKEEMKKVEEKGFKQAYIVKMENIEKMKE